MTKVRIRVGSGEYEAVVRAVFKTGGSLAVRLPRALAEEVGLDVGTPVRFRKEGRGILVEPASE
ncbi:MAG: AbrB/MazE/SpoVT family DNA-binding domain-containing protein [Euryarchaeota archaeon]|nr:AbrB/MazE/SpoVT family DNA-binding domain-containing protein [Euryarchaeota archaeon]